MLFDLCETAGVSGFEQKAADKVKALLQERANEVFTDTLGSVHAKFYSKKRGMKRLLIDAHIDQVGLMVTKITNDGMLKFCKIGGIDERILPACRVKVHGKKELFGVVCALPPHVLTAEDYKKPICTDNMFIDIGLSNELACELVSVGDVITFDAHPKRLMGTRICSKALDDRCGVVSVIMALDMIRNKIKNIDIEVMFSVTEETSQGGAKTGAYNSDADLCICVDVSHAATPDSSKITTYELGGGTLIGFAPSLKREISDELTSIARKNEIVFQKEIMGGSSGTNAWVIDVVKKGIPCGLLSIPLRYMHTGIEIIDMKDVESTARLLGAYIKKLDSEV